MMPFTQAVDKSLIKKCRLKQSPFQTAFFVRFNNPTTR